MRYDENVLTRTERRIFALRTLYSSAGYRSYRMRKFEDYDLYSRNKDFLVSDRVITFMDTNGKLKALKPDVTLSVVRNIKDDPGELTRLYYDENVYRVSERTNSYREIMQMGLECIGNADNAAAAEVIGLAGRSLRLLAGDRDHVLRISDMDILTLIIDEMTDSRQLRSEILKLISGKNRHELIRLCEANGLDEKRSLALAGLTELLGAPSEIMPRLAEICRGTAAEEEIEELAEVIGGLEAGSGHGGHTVMDFSIVSDTSYYNGMAFEGYIEGIPERVLVGGRYDNLMRRMKKKSRAIGFAVYLDTLAGLSADSCAGRADNE